MQPITTAEHRPPGRKLFRASQHRASSSLGVAEAARRGRRGPHAKGEAHLSLAIIEPDSGYSAKDIDAI